MPVFSFTAPVVTQEEEKIERELLSETEKNKIHHDLYGSNPFPGNNSMEDDNNNNNNNNNNNMEYDELDGDGCEKYIQHPELVADLDRDMHEHMERLPQHETREYYEALAQAPDLMRKECNPLKFLDDADYDAVKAATKLVSYWKVRKDLFGKRAYLPMTLSGAMLDDIEALRKGSLQLLPNDVHGRSVLFLDRVRCVAPILSRIQVNRILFYLLNIIFQRNTRQERQVVFLFSLKGFDLYVHFDRMLTKSIFRTVLSSGIRKVAFHVFYGAGQSVVSQLVLPVVKQICGKETRLRIVEHQGSDMEIIIRLTTFGIGGDHVNSVVTGSYKRDRVFDAFLFEQEESERLDQQGQ